jgi:cytochrome d ubiquinol oxidase subunit II
MFSWLYTPLLLILFALIIRGVSFEFRGKVENELWKKIWDWAIFTGSFLPSLLFGVAFGNIFEGLLIDADGYHGSLFSLLNPYGLLTGVLFVLLFLVHGAIWIGMKTDGDLAKRAKALVPKLWMPLVAVAVLFLIFTYFATPLYGNFFAMPAFLLVPVTAVAALLAVGLFKSSLVKAFAASCVTILMVVFTGVIGIFPNLLPSRLDPAYSLTAFNSSSSDYTLTIMTVVVVIFVPIVIAYQIWTYWIFRHPVSPADVTDPDVETY